ncbi:MAG: hypothetical protein PUC65_03820 [Clostridiales bacterium]|nr:hypothetical protein [Clostridiales bacterium]
MEEEKKRVRIQKVTQKILIIFVVSMIILSIISKVANSIMVPTVMVEKVSRGGIVYDIEGSGELLAKEESKIDVYAGLDVVKVPVKCGEQIQEGDILVQYDPDSIEHEIAKQYQNLLNAQQDYLSKKTAYEDTLAKTELTEAQKVAKEAKEELDKAEFDLSKAQTRYNEKMNQLASRLKEDQQKDYEQVTEDKEKASEAYEECKKEYDKLVAKAEEELQKVSTAQAEAVRDAQRQYDSAALAYEEYTKDFNRVNNAFLTFTTVFKKENSDPDKKLQDLLLREYFGESTFEMIQFNSFNDFQLYDQTMPVYNKIVAKIFEFESAVNSRSNITNEEGIAQADQKVNTAYDKLYQLVVKPFEVDKVVANEKQLSVTVAKEKLDKLNDENSIVIKNATDTYNETVKKLDKQLEEAEEAYLKAKKAYDKVMSKVYSDSDSEENLLTTLENAKDKRDAAQKALETAEAALTKEEKISMNNNSLLSLSEHTLNSAMLEISKIEEEIKQLEDLKANQGILYATCNGTVTETSVNNYSTTTGAEKIIVASDECYFRGKITKDMMEYVEKGDEIDLKLTGIKTPVSMEVTKVYLDAQNNEIAYIEADLSEAGYTVGTTGRFRYEKSGETSQNCISMTALREQEGEYYVLVPREENSILGDIVRACSVNVKVIEKDSKTAIIEGAISNGDLVITGSSKIIKGGDIVRMNE